MTRPHRRLVSLLACAWLFSNSTIAATDAPPAAPIPTGKTITPTAARGALFQDLDPHHPDAPEVRANGAAALAVSPDGRRLAILTSGYNRNFLPGGKTHSPDKSYVPELSSEYVFVFDITGPQPEQLQVLELRNAFQGLAWTPSSDRLFASGGVDDTVVEFVRTGGKLVRGRTLELGHTSGVGLATTPPETGALAVSPDGKTLLVANLQNDSVSLLDLASGRIMAEQDLRPGKIDPTHQGEPGGSFPRSVVWTSASHAYVASERDREILSLNISGSSIRVAKRLSVEGQPVALLANPEGTRLYATLDTSDQVVVFDTTSDTLIEAIDATAPQRLYANKKKLGGANPNALALTPDERTLLVSNGGENAIAVIRLGSRALHPAPAAVQAARPRDNDGDEDNDGDADTPRAGPTSSTVIGLVPTGWYPIGVATSKEGRKWYIVNRKHPPGPNVGWCRKIDPANQTCVADNVGDLPSGARKNGFAMLSSQGQGVFQLEKSGFLTIPAPAPLELARLTTQVARNNHFDRPRQSARDKQLFAFLRKHIHHVIYIIKENRSYDQVLGDLEVGNGDPRLTLFPRNITPNHHALARQFVTLDNFLVSGEVSWSGWDWAVAAQTNDFRERDEPITTAGRGLEADSGLNRNINVGLATSQERHSERAIYPADPDILPGEHDITAPDGPNAAAGKGYLWDAALRAHKTLRNWGFFGENRNYPPKEPLLRDPYSQKRQVFFATKAALRAHSDPYYLDFTPAFPDFWRIQEWRREFASFSARGSAPNLMLVRLGNDHFGAFADALDGVDTPDTQIADNDYALGRLIETVANSPFARDTLIIAIEDDACDGPDHVDAHRSIALFAGPYVKQHAVVSHRYTTVNIVKTIEAVLGLEPIGLNDTLETPMYDLFDTNIRRWSYKAIVPDILRTTRLPLPPALSACHVSPRHSRDYWARVMAGQDFSNADRIDPVVFDQALWRGLKGDTPYPVTASGADLSSDRARLLSSTATTGDNSCVTSAGRPVPAQ